MGVIPEFERRRLASSAVGTPGVDQSGAILGEAVGRAAGEVQNTTYGIAVQRQEAKDAALANKTLIDLDMNLETALQKHQEENAGFRGDKNDRIKRFQDRADELFRATVEAVPSRQARDMVERHGYATLKEKIMKEMKAADLNQGTLAFQDGMTAGDTLAQRAGQVALSSEDAYGKSLQLSSLLKHAERTYAVTAPLLSPENQAKLKTALPEAIAKGFLVTSIPQNPEVAAEMLDNGTFDSILKPEEKTKLRNDAREALPKVKERREVDALLGGMGENMDLWNSYVNGDPKLLGRLNEMDTPFAKSLRDLVLKGDPDPVTQATAFMDLDAKLDAMMTGKPGTSGRKVNNKTKLETLQEFANDVVAYRRDGLISKDEADGYLKKITVPLYEKIKIEHEGQGPSTVGEAFQNFRAKPSGDTLYQIGTAIIKHWFDRNNRGADVEAKSRVIENFLRNYDPDQVKTHEQASALARKSIVDAAQNENPGLGLIAGTPNGILNADGSKTSLVGGKSDVKDATKIGVRTTPTVFKDGDERTVSGVTYVRKEGLWRPKKNS